MIFLAVIDRRIELSQDVLLFSRHIYRNLHSGMNVQVALLSIANTTDAVASHNIPISAKCHDREEYTTPGSTERKRSVRAFVNELWK